MWIRKLRSGQYVSYDNLLFKEVVALATALDEWELIIRKKSNRDAKEHRKQFPNRARKWCVINDSRKKTNSSQS